MAFELRTSLHVTPWFPPSCFPLHHTLSVPLLPRTGSLWALLSVLFSAVTVGTSVLLQRHILHGCEEVCSIPSEIWLFELGKDQLCIKCHRSSAGVVQFNLLLLQWQRAFQAPSQFSLSMYIHLPNIFTSLDFHLFSCSTFFPLFFLSISTKNT